MWGRAICVWVATKAELSTGGWLQFSGWPLVGIEGMKLSMVTMGIHSLIPYHGPASCFNLQQNLSKDLLMIWCVFFPVSIAIIRSCMNLEERMKVSYAAAATPVDSSQSTFESNPQQLWSQVNLVQGMSTWHHVILQNLKLVFFLDISRAPTGQRQIQPMVELLQQPQLLNRWGPRGKGHTTAGLMEKPVAKVSLWECSCPKQGWESQPSTETAVPLVILLMEEIQLTSWGW